MAGTYAILLHWRLKPGREADFEEAWEAVTIAMLGQKSLGSALFEAPDGTVYALARWPDRAARERAYSDVTIAGARAVMADAIAETLPSVELVEGMNHWVAGS